MRGKAAVDAPPGTRPARGLRGPRAGPRRAPADGRCGQGRARTRAARARRLPPSPPLGRMPSPRRPVSRGWKSPQGGPRGPGRLRRRPLEHPGGSRRGPWPAAPAGRLPPARAWFDWSWQPSIRKAGGRIKALSHLKISAFCLAVAVARPPASRPRAPVRRAVSRTCDCSRPERARRPVPRGTGAGHHAARQCRAFGLQGEPARRPARQKGRRQGANRGRIVRPGPRGAPRAADAACSGYRRSRGRGARE